MNVILIILLLLFVFGGGGGYYGYRSGYYSARGFGFGSIGLLVMVLLVILLFRA